MRALITGGSGFLGAHLARALHARGDAVTCLDAAPRSPLLDDLPAIGTIRADVGSWAEVLHAVRETRPETVFHAAGILSASAEARPQAAYHANATGTYNILEAAALLGIARVVFTSTIATYGPGVGKTVNEETAQRPTTMYGVTKAFGENLGDYYWRRFGVDFRGVRLPSVIGAGRGPGGASAYSSLVVSEAAAGRAYTVPVEEGTRIPLLYVDDAVAALIGISEADNSRLRRRNYGVAGISPSAGELVEAIRREVPDADLQFQPDRELLAIVETWPEVLDASEARDDWGWTSRYDLAATVRAFVVETRTHPNWIGPTARG